MNIQQNISLKNYNTFGIDVIAKRFVTVTSFYELQQLLKTEQNLFLLSGGSNMLLTKAIDKLVVHIAIKGISIDKEEENFVHLTVNSGENWHEFVLWCIAQDFGGLENLSLIPGNVGTCPIQNIGAYGVEVKDHITSVEALEIATGKLHYFSNTDCNFGYRNSVFKNECKDQFIITSVRFKLTKNKHQLTTSYGAIASEMAKQGVHKPTITAISDAVIAIRKLKLPNPKEIGNSGSFFKNPVVSLAQFKKLEEEYPEIPSYPISADEIKIPAGWLVEKAGFKGKRYGDAGVHKNQALVLVNYGSASGEEIFVLAKRIQQKIKQQFTIALEIEVNIIA